MLADMTAASAGRPGGRPHHARFSFWVDTTGTLGPVLLRYDRRGRGARGARLGVDGRWHASAQPDQLMWLGTGSGDALDADKAREVARQLGFPDLDLIDPMVLP